jgi:hypothetical protein
MTFRTATLKDCALLAELNHQLIRDEGHPNRMTMPELEQRMRAWLSDEYCAVIFELHGNVVRMLFFESSRERFTCGSFLLSEIAADRVLVAARWSYSAVRSGRRARH